MKTGQRRIKEECNEENQPLFLARKEGRKGGLKESGWREKGKPACAESASHRIIGQQLPRWALGPIYIHNIPPQTASHPFPINPFFSLSSFPAHIGQFICWSTHSVNFVAISALNAIFPRHHFPQILWWKIKHHKAKASAIFHEFWVLFVVADGQNSGQFGIFKMHCTQPSYDPIAAMSSALSKI